MDTVTLAVSTRGPYVESVHRGSVAVVNQHGDLVYSAGDPDFLTFTRSTIKPFQAAPFVAADGPSATGFTEREIALMCASHSGEPMHVQAVRDMLEKIGCGEQDLHCGCHPPLHFTALELPVPPQAQFNQLHNNCSGKHAGFLAWCVMQEAPLYNYLNLDHPLQEAVRHSLSHFTGLPQQSLKQAIDGCSAPNYAMPLWRLAFAYARLAGGVADAEFGDTLNVLFHAMTAHPEFVSGAGRCEGRRRRGAGDRHPIAGYRDCDQGRGRRWTCPAMRGRGSATPARLVEIAAVVTAGSMESAANSQPARRGDWRNAAAGQAGGRLRGPTCFWFLPWQIRANARTDDQC
jgi:L-asparaginase II